MSAEENIILPLYEHEYLNQSCHQRLKKNLSLSKREHNGTIQKKNEDKQMISCQS